jgi:hypothetical protein
MKLFEFGIMVCEVQKSRENDNSTNKGEQINLIKISIRCGNLKGEKYVLVCEKREGILSLFKDAI